MQGAAVLVSPTSTVTSCSLSVASLSVRSLKRTILPLRSSSRRFSISAQREPDYVVYDEKKSVFPAEACEDLGGDSCGVDGVWPEVKGTKAAVAAASPAAAGGPDREYVDYKEKKTVFPGEACDDLGGEFCEPDYQDGVFPEKVGAK